MITESLQISEHFHSTEFRCQHCGNIKIEKELVNKMEHIFSKLNASKCIISSGYRCREYDIQIGGFAGRHSEGLAADCVYYDENGSIIPAKIVCCVAYDLGELNGIANIDGNYVHLDNRKNGTYKGDEGRGNSSYWTDPYSYFGVSKEDVRRYTKEVIPQKSIDELAQEVINGVYGNGKDRKKALGDRYNEVQTRVNELLKPKYDYLSNVSYTGVSIVDALNEIGIDSSYNYRTKLAEVNGINNYCGSAEQNTELLNKLKNGNLIKA